MERIYNRYLTGPTVDDGGARKSSYRFYRRKVRRHFMLLVSLGIGLVFIACVLRWVSVFKIPRYRWVDVRFIPPLPEISQRTDVRVRRSNSNAGSWWEPYIQKTMTYELQVKNSLQFKPIHYGNQIFHWETLHDISASSNATTIRIDYTSIPLEYPGFVMYPPNSTTYPQFKKLGDILKQWPQDELDQPFLPFVETLQHFDFQDSIQIEAAVRYRDMELPFKVYNIPEFLRVRKLWTDDYLSDQFDGNEGKETRFTSNNKKRFGGVCQESIDNFFPYFTSFHWDVHLLGPPPTKENDLLFRRWALHARYADRYSIPSHVAHYYWQATVSEQSLRNNVSSFIGTDLPSFSSLQPTFFVFHPQGRGGIQCRFGERGVTTALHHDAGRNMVAMISGAKRYILFPPNQISKLGIVTEPRHPGYRHSYLNFGHFKLLHTNDSDAKHMPKHEKAWLEIASNSDAVETVLKEGEVLYIPSHWFHYIISLQKSCQCNARSGDPEHFNPAFGGKPYSQV